MGSAESTLANLQSQQPGDVITTISERVESVDPLLEQLKSLEVTTPILTSPPTENSLTDILVKKPSSASVTGGCFASQQLTVFLVSSLNPKVLLELLSMYRDWQEEKARMISKRQEEIDNKIEVADALAVKLLQRYNYSVSTMRTTAHNLSEVHPLQVEVGELKGRLTEVLSNCDALCKRISVEGPESLRSSVKPFAMAKTDVELDHGSSPKISTGNSTKT
ncbi:uncharacterized protein LOC122658743 isoform X1 [Telopea speciosissima]|uniref:uncharacterized protein LOC122658743 isoform X1 n=1 Tax=Telopea speciosissima TaxID=54955 RepID=UPI001CC43E47|nr:uncharacterized protein LOC122658743 isoform X1 [Telopea speciosissima]